MGKPALVIRRNEHLLNPTGASKWHYMLADRNNCEKDYSLLQLIPYISLVDFAKNSIFTYVRGTSGEESKLHTKLSIGLGGHIDELPGNRTIYELILVEALRELEEEAGLVLTEAEKINFAKVVKAALDNYCFVLETSNPVDLLHLCIPLVISVDSDKVMENLKPEKKVIEDCKFITMDSAVQIANGELADTVEFEFWSSHVIKNFDGIVQEAFAAQLQV